MLATWFYIRIFLDQKDNQLMVLSFLKKTQLSFEYFGLMIVVCPVWSGLCFSKMVFYQAP
ncbi:MAG: hypothetical protein EBS53_11520 [Bacteroidetes bacterium]|nr:hypothetical protein [Bacteroidota bacterium]